MQHIWTGEGRDSQNGLAMEVRTRSQTTVRMWKDGWLDLMQTALVQQNG